MKTEKLTDLPWVNVYKRGTYLYTSRSDTPNPPDAVIIVPIHFLKNPINNVITKRLVIIKEYRHSIMDYEYGFPAGLRDKGEPISDCAKRELHEETGLEMTGVILASPIIYSSSGMTDESVVMVYCQCKGNISNKYKEKNEDISVDLLDINQIDKLCNNHRVKQSAKLWPTLLMFNMLGTLDLTTRKEARI